jgi:hypothetical protein
MSALTTRLGLYKPGGGLTGLITPDEVADIDKINSNMDKLDAAIGYFVCTSTTRPSSPFPGQPIFETDTKNVLYWNAGSGQWFAAGSSPRAASDALRDALYPAPVSGDAVIRTDHNGLLQIYTGTRWVYSNGRIIPTIDASTGTTATVDAGGVVTATALTALSLKNVLADYRIVELELALGATTSVGITGKLRSASTDLTGTGYSTVWVETTNATGPTGQRDPGTGFWDIARLDNGPGYARLRIVNVAAAKTMTLESFDALPTSRVGGGRNTSTAQFPDFSILSTTAFSGTVSAIGYDPL